MDNLLLNSIPNLGVGVAAVIVVYLCFKTAIGALNERDRAFKEFVESNNHRSVEIMAECRDVIHEAADNIKTSTEIQRQVIERMIKEK